MLFQKTVFLSLLFSTNAVVEANLRGGANHDPHDDNDNAVHARRHLQITNATFDEFGRETCQANEKWKWQGDGTFVHPVIMPCTQHSDCDTYNGWDLEPGWEPCCVHKDCLCGTTQSLFTPGVLHCAKFACTSDADCGVVGRCIDTACNFDHVQPFCRTTADCLYEHQVCVNGLCNYRDPVTGFINFNLPAGPFQPPRQTAQNSTNNNTSANDGNTRP